MEENAIRGRASGGRNFFVRMGSSEIRERKESRERYTGPRVRNRNCQSLTFVAEIARPRCREANFKERNVIQRTKNRIRVRTEVGIRTRNYGTDLYIYTVEMEINSSIRYLHNVLRELATSWSWKLRSENDEIK